MLVAGDQEAAAWGPGEVPGVALGEGEAGEFGAGGGVPEVQGSVGRAGGETPVRGEGLILIYILIVGWFRSLRTPLIIMAAIPFSLVGILPAHWAMGAFFTATSMIGFMAGAGIVVRNSIILVDFITLRLRQGRPLQEAVVDAGAVRFRPMMLTAAAVTVGGSVILFDPIFQGLAISLIAGEVASLLLSRMAVPIIYYLAMRERHPQGSARPGPGATGPDNKTNA